MCPSERKTGQSTDAVKERLINPVLLKCILNIPELPEDLSIIDFGPGDATSSKGLISGLLSAGKNITNLALIDPDVKIFPDLIGTISAEPIDSFNIQVVQAGKRNIVAEFLRQFEGKYDLAISQLVLHQIPNEHNASYLIYLAYQALKSSGDLLVVNLHPQYLQYLKENEPDKFKVTDSGKDLLTGRYFFDTSGSAPVYSRSIVCQLAMFLGLGFDLVKVIPISTLAIADQKLRYRQLVEKKIPMFYVMQLKKNPDYFISSTMGELINSHEYDPQRIRVTFTDKDEIRIPKFPNWEKVAQGSLLALYEIRRNDYPSTILNYWIIDPQENITGGQLFVSTKKLI